MAFGDVVNSHVDSDGNDTAAWPFTPTAGHVLAIFACRRNGGYSTAPTGWTLVQSNGPPFSTGFNDSIELFVKTSNGTEASAVFDSNGATYAILEIDGSLTDAASNQASGTGGSILTGSMTPTAGVPVAIFGGAVSAIDAPASWTPGAGWSEVIDTQPGSQHPAITVVSQVDAVSGGSYDPAATVSPVNSFTIWHGITLLLYGAGGDPDPEDTPTPDPLDPGRAIIEIYTTPADSDRWDEALWDGGVWSAAEWTDISPWCVTADVVWGADRGDYGILATIVAGTWVISTFDPDRVLDPSNADSPFYPELVAGLPIRVNHEGETIRTGIVRRLTYSHAGKGGSISATDAVSTLSNAKVPEDTILPDTLYARATAAIEAAGLDIYVRRQGHSGPFVDPPLAPAPSGEFSAWDVITHAALEVLHIASINRLGELTFRAWDNPVRAGYELTSPELVDLEAWTDDVGLYSVVRVLDDDTSTVIERRATPTPSYGERVYERTEATIHGGTWADAILADRRDQSLRFIPGDVRPLDAPSVRELVRRQVMEDITLRVPEAEPDVAVEARILGIRFRVWDETTEYPDNIRTRWRWRFVVTEAAVMPLVEDDGGANPEFLMSDDDPTEYLYPDGVQGL